MLKASARKSRLNRSVRRVCFMIATSKRDWNGPRKVLRPVDAKAVSYVSHTWLPLTVAHPGTPRVPGWMAGI